MVKTCGEFSAAVEGGNKEAFQASQLLHSLGGALGAGLLRSAKTISGQVTRWTFQEIFAILFCIVS